MNKNPVIEPEAVYVAFPVKTRHGKITFDVPGGLVQPGEDQIPGTASDWNTVQHFVAVGDSVEGRWIFSSPEIPLYQLGGLNLGKFYKDHKPASGHIFSWVMNNYWTTNFRATQEGEFTWRYFITYSVDPEMEVAYRFGWSSRSPLVGRVFPPGRDVGMPDTQSMFSDDLSGLLLISAGPGPENGSITLGLREISGNLQRLDPKRLFAERQKFRWREVDALGNTVEPAKEYIVIQPYSVCFIEARWEM
jgi:hypothetical protein